MTQTRTYPSSFTGSRQTRRTAALRPSVGRVVARTADRTFRRRPSDEAGYVPHTLCRTRLGRVLTAGGMYSALMAVGQMAVCPLWGLWLLASAAVTVIGLRL